MFAIESIIQRAKTSGFFLSLLNFGLKRVVPFNKPHGFAITKLEDRKISTFLPYKRKNLNHIKSLHACSMATLAEFTTGFLLMCNLDLKKYRLIMKKIEMEYFYQGKTSASAVFEINETWLQESVLLPIQRDGMVLVDCLLKVTDAQNNHLCTGKITWQIKDWQKVKTKISSS